MKKFEGARVGKSIESFETQKKAAVTSREEFDAAAKTSIENKTIEQENIESRDTEAATVTSREEFEKYAKKHVEIDLDSIKDNRARNEVIDTILEKLADKEERTIDRIVSIIDQAGFKEHTKDALFEALANAIDNKNENKLDLSQVIKIIESSNLDLDNKKELVTKLEGFVDSLSLKHEDERL